MSSNKPNVIPTKEQVETASKQPIVYADDIPSYARNEAELAAEAEMMRRTEEQKKLRAEMARIQATFNNAQPMIQQQVQQQQAQQQQQFIQPPKPKIDRRDINAPYDMVPLPSEGMIYPCKKKYIKVAYMNASDENLLTAPHLIESGEFMDILLERKIIDDDISPDDLHVGDRNAIMIWLRQTAYGHIYPVELMKGEKVIEGVIDLSKIKVKRLGATPDKNGLFEFNLPVSGRICKFKLLSVKDNSEIEKFNETDAKLNDKEYSDTVTYRLSKHIVEIDGESDVEYVKQAVKVLPIGDSRALRKYIDEIESGLDLMVDVEVPGGEPIKTFLPIRLNFFWPEL